MIAGDRYYPVGGTQCSGQAPSKLSGTISLTDGPILRGDVTLIL